MKKHLSLILRLLVALAGIGYIAYVVDWTDKLEVPPGQYELNDGQTLNQTHTQAYRLSSGDFDPAQPEGVFEAVIPSTPDHDGGTLRVAATDLQPTPEPGRDIRLRPGLLTTLRHADLTLLALGLLLVGPIYFIAAFRWWLLLRARGLAVTLSNAFRLSMVGCFFNYCMPGSTGGDLVKAYYAAKGAAHRPDAVMTVIIDRVVGLLGLVVLAAIAGCLVNEPRVNQVTTLVWMLLAVIVVISAFYFSRNLRQWTGLDRLLSKVLKPGSILSKIEQAASAYANHKGVVTFSIAMSLVVHTLIAVSGALAGYALGMQTPLTLMLAVIPILILVAAVPISYQGFGFMEVLAIRLLATPGLANANQIVVMLLLIRLFQVFYSLWGSVYVLRGDIRMHPELSSDSAETSSDETPASQPTA